MEELNKISHKSRLDTFGFSHNIKDFKGINKFGVRAIAPKILLEEIK